jgi:phosphoglycerate dehydrogenase-like enzyme
MSTDQLHDFLKACDYVVSTLPQTDETDNLLDAGALGCLPANAYFINVGRGNVVDDDALVDALNNGQLGGAALDVFDEEPVPKESPLWETANLSITAHVAAISYTSLIVPIFVENYQRYVNQQPLQHVIDFDAGY